MLEASKLGKVTNAGLVGVDTTQITLAHVRRAAAPSPSSPGAWARCASLQSAAASGRVSLAVARAHSTEVVLRGVPRALLAGVMADLEDPQTQRLLLVCAMRALQLPVTDSPAFVYASCARTPSDSVSPRESRYSCAFSAAARSDCAARDAALAVERTLEDIAVSMWGLPSLDGCFHMLSSPPSEALPMACSVAPACYLLSEPLCRRIPALAAAAVAGDACFVLETSSRRTAVDAPAPAVRLLRVHGFPDARILGACELQSMD